MQAIDLSKVVAGFNDPVHDSQRVFRDALQALSHPGEVAELIPHAEIPEKAQPSAAVMLLALLDADSSLWLSPTIAASDAAHWIVFHTNCTLVKDPAQADFAWLHSMNEMPALTSFNQGSDEYPELSTTCLLNLEDFDDQAYSAHSLTLQGPGISGTSQLRLKSLSVSQIENFVGQWCANNQQFPKGVDFFLCGTHQIAGLPRTTKLSLTLSTDSVKG